MKGRCFNYKFIILPRVLQNTKIQFKLTLFSIIIVFFIFLFFLLYNSPTKCGNVLLGDNILVFVVKSVGVLLLYSVSSIWFAKKKSLINTRFFSIHSSIPEKTKYCSSLTNRRGGSDNSSRESCDNYAEISRPQNPTAILTQNLLVEIRQAVNEAQPRGKEKRVWWRDFSPKKGKRYTKK